MGGQAVSAREIVKSAVVLVCLFVGAYAALCLVIASVLWVFGLIP